MAHRRPSSARPGECHDSRHRYCPGYGESLTSRPNFSHWHTCPIPRAWPGDWSYPRRDLTDVDFVARTFLGQSSGHYPVNRALSSSAYTTTSTDRRGTANGCDRERTPHAHRLHGVAGDDRAWSYACTVDSHRDSRSGRDPVVGTSIPGSLDSPSFVVIPDVLVGSRRHCDSRRGHGTWLHGASLYVASVGTLAAMASRSH